MWYKEDNFKVKIGGNYYIDTPNIIVYKGESIFSIVRAERSDLLGINFEIYDKRGEKIASVKQGRIYKGNADLYEIISEKDRYTLIEKATDKTICDIKKRELAGESELEVTVNLYTKDGFLIEATPTKTNIATNSIKGSTFTNCGAGIAVG